MVGRFRNEAGSADHVLERTATSISERHLLSKRFRWIVAAAILTCALGFTVAGIWIPTIGVRRCAAEDE
ncbi:MAG: hypothetical protein F4Y03_09870 [Alphaproteobacteria bacterium]|nr:hypothetical protein [Alphaproteobacteria bacterium]